MTDLALVVARFVHIGAAILLFGEMLFALMLARVGVGTSGHGVTQARIRRNIAWALVASALSWAAWLGIVAGRMAGTALRQALDVSTATLVLRESEFGHWWCIRIGVLAILAIAWSAVRRSADDGRQSKTRLLALGLAAIYLATLAFAGHATAATQGAPRVVHLFCDALHALAAGAWLGALPALVALLRSGQPNVMVTRGTHVFSILGITSVSALLVTGTVNACFLVGSVAALFDTPYGQLLVAKVAAFAAMLSIASVNRLRLAPRLSINDVAAASQLRRNATLEICGGVLIMAIVATLGTMVPAAHQLPASMHQMR